MPTDSERSPVISYLVTAGLGLLLVVATVIGIIAAARDGGHRPSGLQNHSGVVLYGNR